MARSGKRTFQFGDDKARRKKQQQHEDEFDDSLAREVYGPFDMGEVMRTLDGLISRTTNYTPHGNPPPYSIHAKLEISHPQDAHEKQADQLASAVMEGDTDQSQEILSKPVNEVSRKGEGNAMTTPPGFDQQLQSSKGQGQKLDEGTKSELEQHTGTDLSDVNVHTSSAADALSQSINAKAFAHGQDIYFKQGQYNPQSDQGKELIAHEVAHTVQQGEGVMGKIQRMDDPAIIADRQDKYSGLNPGELTRQLSKDVDPDYALKNLQLLFFGITKGGAAAWKNSVIQYYLMERGWEVNVDPVPLWATHKYIQKNGEEEVVIYTPMQGQLGIDTAYGYIHDKKLLAGKYESEDYESFYYYSGEENRSAFDALENQVQLEEDRKEKKTRLIGYKFKADIPDLTFFEPFPSKQAIVLAKKTVEDFQTKNYIRNPGLEGFGEFIPHSTYVDLSVLLSRQPLYSEPKYGKPAKTADTDNLQNAEIKFIEGNNYTGAELAETGKKANNLLRYFGLFKSRIASAVIYTEEYKNLKNEGYKIFPQYSEAIITSYKDPSGDVAGLFKKGDDALESYKEAIELDLLGDEGAVKQQIDKANEILNNKSKDKFLAPFTPLTEYLHNKLLMSDIKRKLIITNQIQTTNEDPGILLNDTHTILGAVSILANYAMLSAIQLNGPIIHSDYTRLGDYCRQMMADVYDVNEDETVKLQKLKQTVDPGFAFVISDEFQEHLKIAKFSEEFNKMHDDAVKDFIKLCVAFVALAATAGLASVLIETYGLSVLTVTTIAGAGGFTLAVASHTADTLLDGKSFTKGLVADGLKNALMVLAMTVTEGAYSGYVIRTTGIMPGVAERFILSTAVMQFFTEIDYNFEHGHSMSGTERAQSVFNNLLLGSLLGFVSKSPAPVEKTLGIEQSPEFNTLVSDLVNSRNLRDAALSSGDVKNSIEWQKKTIQGEQLVYEKYRDLPKNKQAPDHNQRLKDYEAEMDLNNASWELEFARNGLTVEQEPGKGLFKPRSRDVVEYNGAEGLKWAKKLNPDLSPLEAGVWRSETDGVITYFVENGKAFEPSGEVKIEPVSAKQPLDNANVTQGEKGYKIEYPATGGREASTAEVYREGDRYYRSETVNGKPVVREISKYEFLKAQLKYYLFMFNKLSLEAGRLQGRSLNNFGTLNGEALTALRKSIFWAIKAGFKSVELVIEYLKGQAGFENIDWTKQENKDAIRNAFEEQQKKVEAIDAARAEFNAYGPEWLKNDPVTGELLFNEETGGYVLIHKSHNLYPHELAMAKAFMNAGYKVELLDESGNLAGGRPDAQIIGEGIFDFKNIEAKVNLDYNVMNKVLRARRQAPNLALTLAENPSLTVETINKGIIDAVATVGDYSSLPDKIAVVYSDGKVKILSINEFNTPNGQRF